MRTILSFTLINLCGAFTLSYAQTPTTIYTPSCTVVPDTYIVPELTPAQIATGNEYVETTYPLAQRQSDASATYNCHAYAFYTTEGGGNVWLGYFTTTAEDIYWLDGSYHEVSSQVNPSKVSYASDNHTAVTTETVDQFKSKWGELPVMFHNKDYTPYNSSVLKYYVKREITGPSAFCGTESFSIGSLPTGTTVTWSVTGALYSIVGSATANPVSVSSSGNGTGTLTATISSSCGTFSLTKALEYYSITFTPGTDYPCMTGTATANFDAPSYIWSVVPDLTIVGATGSTYVTTSNTIQLQGPEGSVGVSALLCGDSIHVSRTYQPFTRTLTTTGPVGHSINVYMDGPTITPYATDFTWYLNGFEVPDQLDSHFSSGNLLDDGGQCGSNNLSCWINLTCGGYAFVGQISFDLTCSGSGFSVYPNPANTTLSIAASETEREMALPTNQRTSFKCILYDARQRTVKEEESKTGNITFDTGSLPEGTYFLHIFKGDKVLKRQIAIKH